MADSDNTSETTLKVLPHLEAAIAAEEMTETNYHIRQALHLYHLELALAAEKLDDTHHHVQQALHYVSGS